MTAGISMAFLGPFGTNRDEAARVFADKIGRKRSPSSLATLRRRVRGRRARQGRLRRRRDRKLARRRGDEHARQLRLPQQHNRDRGNDPRHPPLPAPPPRLACGRREDRRVASPGARPVPPLHPGQPARPAHRHRVEHGRKRPHGRRGPTVAGIANEFAANLYGAEVHEREIGDRIGNQTSFALIGRTGTRPVFDSDRYITSLALFPHDNRKGTLSMILSEFVYADRPGR